MRGAVVAALLLVTVPATAQAPDLDRRVGKLEAEVRAVQRKVFPGGDPRYFVPEVAPAAPVAAEPVGSPASAPLTDLTARVGELEGQLRTLTGQVEANQNKLRLLDDALTKTRGDIEFRVTALEAGTRPPAAPPADTLPAPAPTARPARVTLKPPPAEVPSPAATAPKPAITTAAPNADAEWRAAYALVLAKSWDEAEPALNAFLAAHPRAARASDAQYWLGRSFAARKSPAQAAKAFLDGYQKYPKGSRAPDSLLGLAEALVALKKPEQACRSLGELDAVYAERLTPALRGQADKARVAAKCLG